MISTPLVHWNPIENQGNEGRNRNTPYQVEYFSARDEYSGPGGNPISTGYREIPRGAKKRRENKHMESEKQA